MSSPVATIADALIAFILSLLRDPDAAEKFADDPHGAMAENGVQGASVGDVRDVKPVIVDHPQVEPKPPTHSAQTSGAERNLVNAEPDEVIVEISRIMNQFTTVDARSTVSTVVDARATIVDQSVNQSIWTEGGDVTQQFDQEAVIASGDRAVAAGNDASTIDQDLDLTVGDVSVGNDTYTDSFNDAEVDVSAPQQTAPDPAEQAPGVEPEATPAPEAAEPEAAKPEVAGPEAAEPAAVEPAAVEPAVVEAPQTPASLPEPADTLETVLTTESGDTYDPGTAALPVEEVVIDDPVDE
jgi:hypothetical protein